MIKFKKIFFYFKEKYLMAKYPSALQIEITSGCNLKCIMCPHGLVKFSKIDMSFENFKTIIDQFPNLKLVDFTGIGENFLNKDFLKMLYYVKLKKIKVEFVDNFYFMDKKIIGELIKMEVNKIYVSIDGATKETYEKIRVGSDFEKVINNVKNFFRLKKEQNKQFPYIVFNYVVNKYNFNEIIDFVELVSSLAEGQKTLIIFCEVKPFMPIKDFEKFKITHDSEIIKNNIQEAIKIGKGLGIPIISDYGSFKPSRSKCAHYLKPFIHVTGDILPCFNSNRANEPNRELEEVLSGNISLWDILKEISLGNIFKQNFKEIWNNKKYKKFRKTLYQGETHFFCEVCCNYK